MSILAGILNHAPTAGQALSRSGASPMASAASGTSPSGASSSGDASGNSATISANDFLTLLVTEMQNQDPTANTDPNEYINQLVNVNSLEQLIDINQTLTTDMPAPSAGSDTGASGGAASGASGAQSPAAQAVSSAGRSTHAAAQGAGMPLSAAQGIASSTGSIPQTSSISGNLSVPSTSSAAQHVGHALTRRTHSASGGGIPLFNQ